MSSWDVFHSDRQVVERGLSTDQVRRGLASGAITAEDLARPSGGTDPWTPLPELPGLLAFAPAAAVDDDDDDDIVEIEYADNDLDLDPDRRLDVSGIANPVPQDGFRYAETEELEPLSPLADEDDEAAEFTLARGSGEHIEELDLAAMVDVAFQLVLFFLVTATTILYKSLEVPRPNPEQQQEASQGKQSLDELMSKYILVKIDPNGNIEVDRAPAKADTLTETLRKARDETGRTSMLLTADFNTMHRNAVLAYDAANEIGLGIAIARPVDPGPAPGAAPAPGATPTPGGAPAAKGPAPAPPPAAKKAA